MVAGAAVGAHPASTQTLRNLFVRYFDVHHFINGDAHSVQRFCLRHGAGEAVQDKTVLAVILSQPFLDISMTTSSGTSLPASM